MSSATQALVDELVPALVPAVVAQVAEQLATERLYVSVPQAAQMTGLGQSTVWDLIRRGVLPTLDIGVNRTLIPVAALRDLPTKREQVAEDQRGTAAA